jgi:beta-lactamase superfamily II metal-dependent hydrolase
LLTGDISLKHDFPAFWNRFRPFINQTGIVSLPHHGSALSWSPEFMENYAISKFGVSLFIASAGATNSYGHPHKVVVSHSQIHAGKGRPACAEASAGRGDARAERAAKHCRDRG